MLLYKKKHCSKLLIFKFDLESKVLILHALSRSPISQCITYNCHDEGTYMKLFDNFKVLTRIVWQAIFKSSIFVL